MTNAQNLIKTVYGEHFKRLKEIAEHVDSLRAISERLQDQAIKARIDEHVKMLEKELAAFAKNIEESGTELYKNAA